MEYSLLYMVWSIVYYTIIHILYIWYGVYVEKENGGVALIGESPLTLRSTSISLYYLYGYYDTSTLLHFY